MKILCYFLSGDFPFHSAREAGDDVLRHAQQGRASRLQEVHAGKIRLDKIRFI